MMWYDDIFGEINMTLTKRPKTVKKLAEYQNLRAWQMWFQILVNRALTRYKFENLPDTINERVLKLSLLWHASVCIFEKDGHLMALPGATGTNGVTVYGDFTYSNVYGRNGWTDTIPLWLKGQKELPFLADAYLPTSNFQLPRGVWFRENWTKLRFVDICIEFANQLADIWRKMENMRSLLCKVAVCQGAEEDMPTDYDLVQQMRNNSPIIFITRNIQTVEGTIDQLATKPEALKSATDHIEWLLARFDLLCGKMANTNPDKKERMTGIEVTSQQDTAATDVKAICNYMQENGLDVVNLHWGTNIKVVPDREEENDDDLQGMDPDGAGNDMDEMDGSGDRGTD